MPQQYEPPKENPPGRSGSSREEEISKLAYRMWEERGRPVGTDQEDWFRAERQLKPAGEVRTH